MPKIVKLSSKWLRPILELLFRTINFHIEIKLCVFLHMILL